MKHANTNVDQMQLFVINTDGIMLNVAANVKNWLTKEYAIKDLF